MPEKPRVLIHAENARELQNRLTDVSPDLPVHACGSNSELAASVPDFAPDVVYSVRFDSSTPFPTDTLLSDAGPRWISVGGSGCDHLGQWDTSRVTVTNSAGVGAAMMAEFVFGSVLHFTLDIDGLTRDKDSRRWQADRLMIPLRGKTMLIVGLGQTGQAVAARAKAFGMHVLGTRARPEPVGHVDEVFAARELPTLWHLADVVVMCVPLLDATRGLVDAAAFSAMKKTAILVDVSRGNVIVPEAAIHALRTGQIKGAAFDVFHEEPLETESPYWSLPNTIIAPHASAVFEGWGGNSFEMFLENLNCWQRGEPLQRIVDPSRGY
ncbi:MAG: D-2-hydroxyacid dehydrogenase [Pseudomonadota bacterium]